MKKRSVVLLFIVLLMTSGCLFQSNQQMITVQKRVGEGEQFEDFNEITDQKQVKRAIDLVENADWGKKSAAEMSRYADYQFQFPFKNHSRHKISSYNLWVSNDGEQLEITTDGDRYVALDKAKSKELFEILIGE